MNLQDFDYPLPPELIAQDPATVRDQSRLMVLNRRKGTLLHDRFFALFRYLRTGDVVVINDTKVVPARLLGRKESGGGIEVLLVRKRENQDCEPATPDGRTREPGEWECLIQNAGKIRPPAILYFEEGIRGEVLGRTQEGYWRLSLNGRRNLEEVLRHIGLPPLPPYIKRNGDKEAKERDLDRYQTIYARKPGAIAAPTAGLHFTEGLFENLRRHGVLIAPLTLHVGAGTFLPVKADPVEQHRLEPEFFELSEETAEVINRAKGAGGRVFAVGTTAVRALESCVDAGGAIRSRKGKTDLFILPGHVFKAVDGLVTNFHLPRSTLLMLVSAFAGRERLLESYREAVKQRYRFYSYGDAMLIL